MTIDPATDLSRDPAAVRVRKLPVAVQVRWMHEDGVCATLEGDVRYRAGDPLLTGVRGEQWTMPAAAFARAYDAADGTAYGSDGRYRKKPLAVWALRLAAPASVAAGGQRDLLQGQPGDWLVQYGPGDFGIVAADIFAATYELLG